MPNSGRTWLRNCAASNPAPAAPARPARNTSARKAPCFLRTTGFALRADAGEGVGAGTDDGVMGATSSFGSSSSSPPATKERPHDGHLIFLPSVVRDRPMAFLHWGHEIDNGMRNLDNVKKGCHK